MLNNLLVCIITLNEELHLERCLLNAKGVSKNILVVDSGSVDRTEFIARKHKCSFVYNKFFDYGTQRMFAIELARQMGYSWLLFLDADEYLTSELIKEINGLVDDSVEGYVLKRRFIWSGKWIKHGGYYPTKLLRLFKLDSAYVSREINEHIKVEGVVRELKNDFVDENLNSIEFWVEKHNRYSTLEAENWVKRGNSDLNLFYRVFRKLPLITQPFVYFFYRVIIRGGFRDGASAVWYHYLHAFVMFGLTSYKFKTKDNVRDSRFHK